MSPKPELRKAAADGFPRVSGDEPLQAALVTGGMEFSPRERG